MIQIKQAISENPNIKDPRVFRKIIARFEPNYDADDRLRMVDFTWKCYQYTDEAFTEAFQQQEVYTGTPLRVFNREVDKNTGLYADKNTLEEDKTTELEFFFTQRFMSIIEATQFAITRADMEGKFNL